MLVTKKKKCCCGCSYFTAVKSDPASGQVLFSAALGTTITVLDGDWDIDGGGRLRVTGTGMIVLETSQPSSESKYAISFTSDQNSGTISGDPDRLVALYLDYVDVNNHHVAEGGCDDAPSTPFPPAKVARVVGGSESVLSTGQPFYFSFSLFSGVRLLGGFMCFQGTSVAAAGPLQTVPGPKPATTPVGGFKAAVKVTQGATETFTFEDITLSKLSDPSCPLPETFCHICMSMRGCFTIPAGGFLVTLQDVANGVNDFFHAWCSAGADSFNGSFTCDQLSSYALGVGAPFGADGWACPWFELDPDLSCAIAGPITFTHGRIILEPTGYDGVSPVEPDCPTPFRLHLMATNFPESPDVNNLIHRYIGTMTPTSSSGNDVGWACEEIELAEFSGGGQERLLDTTNASFTIEALA